jgi:hypothetical protein
VLLDAGAGWPRNTNLTLTGQVLDNLSGVATPARIDGGTPRRWRLDADGPLQSHNGAGHRWLGRRRPHPHLTATDARGNTSAPFTLSFTLDTRAPAITLTSLADGTTLGADSQADRQRRSHRQRR